MRANEIKRARERRGLTQQQLATALGVGLRTVGNWERGETVPRNRMTQLEEFFSDEPVTDPLRSASDLTLLAELMRRAADREQAHRAGNDR